MSDNGNIRLRMTKDLWSLIGEAAGWLDVGYGAGKFKFYSGPGVYCVCPFCGHMKKSLRMMPCERMTCPRCGKEKMEKRYVERGVQMSPAMRGP